MILAFGDSLTNGFGVASKHSYPQNLQNKIGLEVLNGGVDGEFSSEGLERLAMLLKYKPNLVILCHGANDILSKYSDKRLKDNLLLMIEMIKESGANILLVGVPDFYSKEFKVHKLYKELAKDMEIELEDEVLTYITLNSFLRNDEVHPNEKGYELMADAFMNKIT